MIYQIILCVVDDFRLYKNGDKEIAWFGISVILLYIVYAMVYIRWAVVQSIIG